MSYNGKEKNWNLSKHITKFKGLVSILKNMEEKGLYRGVDDDKLVDWFLYSSLTLLRLAEMLSLTALFSEMTGKRLLTT